MRKLILISALLLASASAQAGQSRGLVLAANDSGRPTEVAKPHNALAETATAPETAPSQAAKPAKKVQAKRHEGDDEKRGGSRRNTASPGVRQFPLCRG